MKFYRAGDGIPYSGLYRVIHQGHMRSHEVTCLSGEPFPEGRECRSQVRFVLLSAARSIRKLGIFATGAGSLGMTIAEDRTEEAA